MRPIAELVNLLLLSALKKRAAEIRLRADGNECRVDFAIDGMWREEMRPPVVLHELLCKRLWVLANLPYYRAGQITRGTICMKLAGGRTASFEVTIRGHGRGMEADVSILSETTGWTSEPDIEHELMAAGSPVRKLVFAILLSALNRQAAAVYFRMAGATPAVDFMIDGEWRYEMTPPPKLFLAICRTFWLLAEVPAYRADETARGVMHLELRGARHAYLGVDMRGVGMQTEVRVTILTQAQYDAFCERASAN